MELQRFSPIGNAKLPSGLLCGSAPDPNGWPGCKGGAGVGDPFPFGFSFITGNCSYAVRYALAPALRRRGIRNPTMFPEIKLQGDVDVTRVYLQANQISQGWKNVHDLD